MRLSSILDPSCVILDVGAGSKHDVLSLLVAPILKLRSDLDGDAVLAELDRREAESSTAIADGIAIPHARPAGYQLVTAAFGLSHGGVDFDSLDGQPTRLIFVLISPPSSPELHVQWLAHIARLLSDPATRRRLLEAKTSAEVLQVLFAREEAIEIEPAERVRQSR